MRSEVQLFLGPPRRLLAVGSWLNGVGVALGGQERAAGERGNGREAIGGVAQLGERLPCTQEAIGSNPFTSIRAGVGSEE